MILVRLKTVAKISIFGYGFSNLQFRYRRKTAVAYNTWIMDMPIVNRVISKFSSYLRLVKAVPSGM